MPRPAGGTHWLISNSTSATKPGCCSIRRKWFAIVFRSGRPLPSSNRQSLARSLFGSSSSRRKVVGLGAFLLRTSWHQRHHRYNGITAFDSFRWAPRLFGPATAFSRGVRSILPSMWKNVSQSHSCSFGKAAAILEMFTFETLGGVLRWSLERRRVEFPAVLGRAAGLKPAVLLSGHWISVSCQNSLS